MASARAVCKSVCVFISVCVLPRPPFFSPSSRSEFEADWKSGPRWEGAQTHERMILFLYTLSCCSSPLCCYHTVPLFSPPYPSSHLPPTPFLSVLSRLHFASAAAKAGSHCTERGINIRCLFSLFCAILLPCPFFLWSVYPLFTKVVLRRLGKKIYFSAKILSVCAVHTASFPSSL